MLSMLPAAQTGGDAYQRGAAHFKSGRIEEAIRAFEEATRLHPADARGWRGLGVTHASQADYKRAEEPLKKACELDPRHADGCYYLGLASYNLGRYDKAIDAYKKALRADGRVHTGLGLAYEATGRAEDAERELCDGIAKDDGKAQPDFSPRVEYGVFLVRQGRLEEALKVLEQAPKNSPRAAFEMGRILANNGQLEEAVRKLQHAIVLDRSYAAAHLLLGRLYFRLGRSAEGEKATELGRRLSVPSPQR